MNDYIFLNPALTLPPEFTPRSAWPNRPILGERSAAPVEAGGYLPAQAGSPLALRLELQIAKLERGGDFYSRFAP